MKKKIVLLINIGTPNSPEVRSVTKYLSEFLSDKFVLNIPGILRYLLVHLIIIPRRVFKSANKYKEIWTKEGSPLLVNHQNLTKSLQANLPNDFRVLGAMRYGEPSIYNALRKQNFTNASELIVVPLYPHYAASTTKSSIHKVQSAIKKLDIGCDVKIIEEFYYDSAYIEALSAHIQTYHPELFDYVLFSYHGLPLSQAQVSMDESLDTNLDISKPRLDYVKSCYKTTDLLAKSLNLPANTYSSAFQSRFSKNWTKPFTDHVLRELARDGKKKVLIVSPSFVADCLETTLELGIEYKEDFLANGGKELVLVSSLNDNPKWVESLANIIQNS